MTSLKHSQELSCNYRLNSHFIKVKVDLCNVFRNFINGAVSLPSSPAS